MSSDTLRTALSVAHASRTGHDGQCSGVFGRCASWDEVEATLATPTGKALADVLDKVSRWADVQREWNIAGNVGLVHEAYEAMDAIDGFKEATR